MAKVEVNPGVCGFASTITVSPMRKHSVKINFETTCPSLKPLEQELNEVDGLNECCGKIGDSDLYKIFRKYCSHAACPMPSAIIKGIEVACGLALPRDVEIKISKD